MKWIRVLYSEFSTFSNDQEHLISSENSFDYIEGFVIINRTGLLNNWRSSFYPKDPIQASQFSSDGKILYCLEMAKYFNPDETDILNQVKLDKKHVLDTQASLPLFNPYNETNYHAYFRILRSYCQD